MSSEGFANPIVGGGGALIYPSVHSPDYVAGSAGWTVDKDGSAEFNDATIRGTLVAGTIDISADQISFGNGAYITGSDTDQLVLGGNAGTNGLEILLPLTTSLVAAEPGTTGTPETWHPMSLLNSWLDTGTGEYSRYRLLPDGNVQVQFLIHGGTVTNGTAIWDAAAGYVPSGAAGTQYFAAIVVSGASAAQADTPQFQLSTAGALTITFIASGTTKIAGNFIYSLT